MASPYIERMQQLHEQTTQRNYDQLSRIAGLPIQKPGEGGTSPSGVPTGQAPKESGGQDESYKDSLFYQNFDYHRQNDPHFDNMVGELTQLATGLRQQVQQGFMPPQLAQQRVHQYVLDSMAQYHKAKPQIEQQKNRQMAGIMLQQLAAGVGANGGQDQGQPQQQPQTGPQEESQVQPQQPVDGGGL